MTYPKDRLNQRLCGLFYHCIAVKIKTEIQTWYPMRHLASHSSLPKIPSNSVGTRLLDLEYKQICMHMFRLSVAEELQELARIAGDNVVIGDLDHMCHRWKISGSRWEWLFKNPVTSSDHADHTKAKSTCHQPEAVRLIKQEIGNLNMQQFFIREW